MCRFIRESPVIPTTRIIHRTNKTPAHKGPEAPYILTSLPGVTAL